MIAPVKKPSITSAYGKRVLNGKEEFHDGIDFVSNTGKEVIAIADGDVVYDQDDYKDALRWIDKHHSAGNMFIIRHTLQGKEYYVRYVHIVKNRVSKGQEVREGDVLGIYGDVGYSFGAHLHLDMYDENWKKIDPTPFINPVIQEAVA